MKQKEGFVLREVCGEHVIVGEGLGTIDFGKLISLNETAAWLWQQAVAMDNFTIDTLAQQLCDEYEVSVDEAKTDVAAILDEWQNVGVVE